MPTPKRIRIVCTGNLWNTVVTDLETGATIPVSKIAYTCEAGSQVQVILTIPAAYCEIDLTSRHITIVREPYAEVKDGR